MQAHSDYFKGVSYSLALRRGNVRISCQLQSPRHRALMACANPSDIVSSPPVLVDRARLSSARLSGYPKQQASAKLGAFYFPLKNVLVPSAGTSKVDLGFLRFVSAIGTQGAISQETKLSYYVTSYKVDVSSNGEDWITLKEGSKQKIFQGNSNPTDVQMTELPKPTLTRFVRIRPVSWETGIALRFEVYGCKISASVEYRERRGTPVTSLSQGGRFMASPLCSLLLTSYGERIPVLTHWGFKGDREAKCLAPAFFLKTERHQRSSPECSWQHKKGICHKLRERE
ncbi:hypothetical protein JZ751_028743 [Albula glossodonta]|uniref:F5/8 type C domain-containing protein n=1 Tax=Albula glossodonta TaxID=121402 RepID=A0A8T2NEW5_9TELE|nr:hypothetical protein JZ751_028743 [Albula glossodonta]